MQQGRILIVGQKKDSAYAIRNVFDMERLEIEVALELDVAKAVLLERVIDLIILEPAVCLQDDFDLVDFQLDHDLGVPMVLVGGEASGARRKVRSKQAVKVHLVQADGFRLLEFVRDFDLRKQS
jgi:DNA-binding NtrC family response regulator